LVSSKFKDIVKEEKDFKYKKIGHSVNHIDCKRCSYDVAEESLKIKKSKVKDNDTTIHNKKTFTLKQIKVCRGSNDEVNGWCTQWQ